MKGIAYWFMVIAVVAALCGMAWGIHMAASQDHTLSPAHGHLNLLGWVSCAIYAFYYHLVPEAAQGPLPRLHLALSLASLVILAPGIALAILGQGDGMAKLGSVLALAAMASFGFIVIRTARVAREIHV